MEAPRVTLSTRGWSASSVDQFCAESCVGIEIVSGRDAVAFTTPMRVCDAVIGRTSTVSESVRVVERLPFSVTSVIRLPSISVCPASVRLRSPKSLYRSEFS
jgi:hypothetical protein